MVAHMSQTRIMALAIGLLAELTLFGLVTSASAQDIETSPPEEEAAPQAAEPPVAQPARQAAPRWAGLLTERRPPPPMMVVVLPGRRVSAELATAASAALVSQVEPMARGRAVHALGAEEMVAAIAACGDDACIGAQLGQAGAQGGVILRLERGRRGIDASLELRDPISGTLRREAVTGPLPLEAEGVTEALAPLSAQLADAMPSPPPAPATLTVSVNIDGATVQVDGTDIGESPVAPVDVIDGQHEILVTAPGYLSIRRQTTVRPGDQARLDVTIQPVGETVGGTGGGLGQPGDNAWAPQGEGGDITGEWWFWTIIGGGAAILIGLAVGIGVAVADQGPSVPALPNGIRLPPITGGM